MFFRMEDAIKCCFSSTENLYSDEPAPPCCVRVGSIVLLSGWVCIGQCWCSVSQDEKQKRVKVFRKPLAPVHLVCCGEVERQTQSQGVLSRVTSRGSQSARPCSIPPPGIGFGYRPFPLKGIAKGASVKKGFRWRCWKAPLLFQKIYICFLLLLDLGVGPQDSPRRDGRNKGGGGAKLHKESTEIPEGRVWALRVEFAPHVGKGKG